MRAFVRRHGVRLGDNGYDVDFVVETLHKLHVEWLQSVARGRDEIETAVHSTVWNLPSCYARLCVKELLVFRFDVVDDRHPTGGEQTEISSTNYIVEETKILTTDLKEFVSFYIITSYCCRQRRQIRECRLQ